MEMETNFHKNPFPALHQECERENKILAGENWVMLLSTVIWSLGKMYYTFLYQFILVKREGRVSIIIFFFKKTYIIKYNINV